MSFRWSLSKYGTAEKCGAKYEYKYIKKIPEKRGAAADRGIEFHKIIENFITRPSPEPLPPGLDYYTQFFNTLRGQEIYPEYKVALTREWKPTSWDAEDAWFIGVLDLKLLERGDGAVSPEEGVKRVIDPVSAVIYDWKTGKIYPEHDDQKALYSLAVFSEHPTLQRVRAIHVYTDLGQNREVTYDREQMHSLRELWTSRANHLEERKIFIPEPSFMCRYCSFSRGNGGPCRF